MRPFSHWVAAVVRRARGWQRSPAHIFPLLGRHPVLSPRLLRRTPVTGSVYGRARQLDPHGLRRGQWGPGARAGGRALRSARRPRTAGGSPEVCGAIRRRRSARPYPGDTHHCRARGIAFISSAVLRRGSGCRRTPGNGPIPGSGEPGGFSPAAPSSSTAELLRLRLVARRFIRPAEAAQHLHVIADGTGRPRRVLRSVSLRLSHLLVVSASPAPGAVQRQPAGQAAGRPSRGSPGRRSPTIRCRCPA